MTNPAPSAARAPRTGRRPGPSRSRDVILQKARTAFAQHGYAGASLRGIARSAGVDPTLIMHFFGSKAGLFVAALEWPFDADTAVSYVLAEGRDHIGVRLAWTFVTHWDAAEQRSPIIALLNAATADPAAAALMRDFLSARLLVPLLQRIAADQTGLRAGLLASQLLGLGMARYVLAFDALAQAPQDQAVHAVAPTLQRYCTGPL